MADYVVWKYGEHVTFVAWVGELPYIMSLISAGNLDKSIMDDPASFGLWLLACVFVVAFCEGEGSWLVESSLRIFYIESYFIDRNLAMYDDFHFCEGPDETRRPHFWTVLDCLDGEHQDPMGVGV